MEGLSDRAYAAQLGCRAGRSETNLVRQMRARGGCWYGW
jgi:hypothetical protein